MGRLTEKDSNGNWRLKSLPWEQIRSGATLDRQASGKIYGALCKLLDYEESGLSPEEVVRMKEDFIPPEEKEAIDRAYADMCCELASYKKALEEQGERRLGKCEYCHK